jgi:hypothetical protein
MIASNAAPEAFAGGLMIFMCIFWIVIMLLSLGLMAFWIWMLVDCITKCPDRDNKKLTWVLIIALTHWIGALIYYFVQRPKNAAESLVPPPQPYPPPPPPSYPPQR